MCFGEFTPHQLSLVQACNSLDGAQWLARLMASLLMLNAGYLKLSLGFGLHQSHSSAGDEK